MNTKTPERSYLLPVLFPTSFFCFLLSDVNNQTRLRRATSLRRIIPVCIPGVMEGWVGGFVFEGRVGSSRQLEQGVAGSIARRVSCHGDPRAKHIAASCNGFYFILTFLAIVFFSFLFCFFLPQTIMDQNILNKTFHCSITSAH